MGRHTLIDLHLPDPDSPRDVLFLPNPGYIEYQTFDGPFALTMDDLRSVWGDPFSPTSPMELETLAYCGATLIRVPKVYPELLWECVNYTLPCRIETERICQKCLDKHDAVSRAWRASRTVP